MLVKLVLFAEILERGPFDKVSVRWRTPQILQKKLALSSSTTLFTSFLYLAAVILGHRVAEVAREEVNGKYQPVAARAFT
jgi:hypothetical protein